MRVTKFISALPLDTALNLPLHSLCSAFPAMDEVEYESLVESMRKMGFLNTDPIILINTNPNKKQDETYEILDGRNRRNAAMDAGVEPCFEEYIGSDPVSFVVSKNTDRRHLSTGQKAAIASKIANMPFGGNQFDIDYTTADEAAKMLQTSGKAIQRFRFIQGIDPEIAEEVADGLITLNEGYEKAKQKPLKVSGLKEDVTKTALLTPSLAVPVPATDTRPGTCGGGVSSDDRGGTSGAVPDTIVDTDGGIPVAVETPEEKIIGACSSIYNEFAARSLDMPTLHKLIELAVRSGYAIGKGV